MRDQACCALAAQSPSHALSPITNLLRLNFNWVLHLKSAKKGQVALHYTPKNEINRRCIHLYVCIKLQRERALLFSFDVL
jgi:hypothetical protein